MTGIRRRDFCSTLGLATVASLANAAKPGTVGAESATVASPPPTSRQFGTIPPTKKMLFFDLWKLDYWDNVELVQGTPEFVPEATYVDNTMPEKGAGKPSVFFDRDAGVWRMLYNIAWSPIRLMTAVSDDGIHWEPDPHAEIEIASETPGGKIADHHIFTLPDAAAGGLYVDPVAKDGFPFKMYAQQGGKSVYQRALADNGHPWHKIATEEGVKRYFHDELILVSHDGLNWETKHDYGWSRSDWHPEPPYFGFYNERLKRHCMIVRPGWGDRRVCMQTTSDFHEWSEPELLFQMDPLDTAPVGFYTMPVIPYGHLFVGLLWVFHNASSRPVNSFNQFFGPMDAELTYSYDGVRFTRGKREPFLPLNPYPEHGCTQLRPYSMIEHGHEIRTYSGASRASHGRERALNRQGHAAQAITMHRLREDGFMYLRPRGDWARVQTKPLAVWSPEITLNASAPFGEVRYQITDEQSQPVEGFTFEDCVPFQGEDQFDWELRWKAADSSDLIGKVIRLELEFQTANIYSLTAAYHFLDAQDQWMLKEGKQIDTSRFDY